MFLICFQYFFRILNYHAGGVGVADGVGCAEGPGGKVVVFAGVGVVAAQGLLQTDVVGVDRLECVCGVGSLEDGTRSLGRTEVGVDAQHVSDERTTIDGEVAISPIGSMRITQTV